MSEKIYGLVQHPAREMLDQEYSPIVPSGEFSVAFDDRAWGKSTNLFCYFTDLTSGQKYRLSVFARQNYRPYDNGVSFRDAPFGSRYKITINESKNGLPKFLTAIILPI